MLKGYRRKFPPLELLSEEEMSSIHAGALYVLETTGMRVEHDRLLQQLDIRGCHVDLESRQVRFPVGHTCC